MPDVSKYTDKNKWMAACVPAMMSEGRENDQAVAACMSIWNKRGEKSMDDELIYFSDELKALGDGKIGGFLVRYSTAEDPDLTKDYFDSKSVINIPDNIPLLYNHGMDSTLKKRPIGKVIRTEYQDAGVWAEAQMNIRDDYEKAIYAMAEKGKLGFSSGALSHLVEREPAGKAMHIKTWFIGEASLTPTPAEYRNTVQSLKSLLPPDTALSETGEEQNTKTEINMEDEIKSAVDTAVAEALAKRDAELKAEAENQAALKAAEEAGYKKAIEEVKNRKAPAFNTMTELGFSEEHDAVPAFKHWVATGQVNGGLITPDSSYGNIKDSKAAWNVTTGGSGGFLVPDPLYNQIIAKRDIASFVRQLPTQKFVTQADHLLVPVESTSHTAFTKTLEAAAYTEEEGTVAQVDLVLYKYTKMQKFSEEFLMYNTTNFDSWLVGALARAEAATENTIFHSGTGTAEPLGIADSSGSTVANTLATADTILPSELAAFVGYLGAGYNVPSECAFVMANVTKWYLRGVTHSAGGFAYQSSPDGAIASDRLMGYPIVINDDVSPYTTNAAKIIFFGNWNFYGIVEKPGMIVQRNPYLYMANGQVGLFASIFRGGSTLQQEAIYYLTNQT